MKKLFFILLLSFSALALGQMYKVEMKIDVKAGGSDGYGSPGCKSDILIKIHLDNGEIKTIIPLKDLYKPTVSHEYYISFSGTTFINANRKIVKIEAVASRKWKRLIGGCGGNNSFINYSKFTTVTNSYCRSTYYDIARWWKVNAVLNVTPVMVLTQQYGANLEIEPDQPFNIVAPSGFETNMYEWQYRLGLDGSWISLYRANGQTTMNLRPKDFLYSNYLGKRIYFRIRSCSVSYSDPIFYDLVISPPSVTVTPKDVTSCPNSGSQNGGFTLTFDRNLSSGEKINIALKQRLSGSVIGISNAQITDLNLQKEYVWPSALNAGVYFVEYELVNGSYTTVKKQTFDFEIKAPPPVQFSASQNKPVSCYRGLDGRIQVNASGGAGGFEYELNANGKWIAFGQPTSHIIQGLPAGTFKIKVRDRNGCTELDGSADKEVIVTIDGPSDPIRLSLNSVGDATLYGSRDGFLLVDVSGGTPASDGSYRFYWEDKNGRSIPSLQTSGQSFGGEYRIELNDVPYGDYTLYVSDINDDGTRNTSNCSNARTFSVGGIEELNVSIALQRGISCNPNNIFGNTSDDGQLVGIATGGVPPYTYVWKKKDNNGVWVEVNRSYQNILSNLSEGAYAFNVEDSNGFVAGIYSESTLVRQVDATYQLNPPALLQVGLTKQDVYCNEGADGWVNTQVSGGTPPYSYLWNTGARTSQLRDLPQGTYSVAVTDVKGCQAVTVSITILQPETPFQLEYSVISPTFAGGSNGSIVVSATGGTPLGDGGYSFLWKNENGQNLSAQVSSQLISKTSSTTTGTQTTFIHRLELNNIPAGDYFLSMYDANFLNATTKPNCGFENRIFSVNDPEPLAVVLAITHPISCNSSNTYNDPNDDGVLQANARGGVPLDPSTNNGLPYFYTWKMKDDTGAWQVLSGQTSNVLSNLVAGDYAVNIQDANGIVLGNYVNNQLVQAIDVTATLEEPPLLSITSIINQGTYCYGGSDGWAEVTIAGGSPPYSVLWSNGATTTLAENLGGGTQTVRVLDSRGCQVVSTTFIEGPSAPLNINYVDFRSPTTKGAKDGWIEALITGGTSFANGSYLYRWTNDKGEILNSQTSSTTLGGEFIIRLNNIPLGTYLLSITDANFSKTTVNAHCQIVESDFRIYEPIEAVITIKKPISCNPSNAFDNPFSDGVLEATVTGGLPFSNGEPYIFSWKKKNGTGGFDLLTNHNSAVAEGLSPGVYALNVEDSLGNVIGIYEGYNLLIETDVLLALDAPPPLKIVLNATPISCETDTNGTAVAQVEGGTPPYSLEWSNGATAPKIENLFAGTYLLYVTDARGCEAVGQVVIESPGGLEVNLVDKNDPNCFQGSDGSIEVVASGGVPPYQYLWSNGATTLNINNLPQGEYQFRVTDANNCKAYFTTVLEDPDPILLDLGEDRTLCNNQVHEIDITSDDPMATYWWTSDNGFWSTSSKVSLTEAGTYIAYYTTALGCEGSDMIQIYVQDVEIDAQFLLTSQAFVNEDVILVNTSVPLSEKVEWEIPESVVVKESTNEFISLQFDRSGVYTILLRSFEGECYQEYSKEILVEHGVALGAEEVSTPYIIDFEVFPVPNSGQFTVAVGLAEEGSISLRVFSLTSGHLIEQRQEHGASQYSIDYHINVPSGVYFVLLETGGKRQLRRFVVE